MNSFLVNIDTRDKNQTDYIEENNEIDLTQGEIKFIKKNMDKSKDEYENSLSNLKGVETKLDASSYIQWKEGVPHQLTFHMKFKQNFFGLETFDMSSNYVLNLVRQPNIDLSYKDKIENVFDKSKYSFAKAFNSSGTVHFYHHQCELNIIKTSQLLSDFLSKISTIKMILGLNLPYMLYKSLDLLNIICILTFLIFTTITKFIKSHMI